jgi:hypothetical protein
LRMSGIIMIDVSDQMVLHSRSVYTLLDLLGDYGGLQEMFFLLLGFFIAPFSEHSFVLSAIKKLYLVKTEDKTLFMSPRSEKHLQKQKTKRKIAKKLSTE